MAYWRFGRACMLVCMYVYVDSRAGSRHHLGSPKDKTPIFFANSHTTRLAFLDDTPQHVLRATLLNMPKQTTSRIPHFTQVTLQTPSTFHSQIQKKSQIPYLTRTRAPKSQQAHAKGKEE